MRLNILFGGVAGSGPNILSHLVAEALIEKGYYVFYSRDYQSLIRGGHNFNVLTFSDEPVFSNESKIDIIVALDENTEKIHKKELKKDSIVLKGEDENMYFAGRLFKILCLDFKLLEEKLKNLKNFEENLKNAKKGYEIEKKKSSICDVKIKSKKEFINGSQGITEGAVKSGLDIYYAYPMTPATPLLFELAPRQQKDNILVLELESEISVMMSALGSASTGAKSMVGTSGGGFDLMTEGFSMSGMAEIPIVVYLASRPGPSTGVATYTSQGDLNLARHCGHGEFFRMVLAPGDPNEAQELISHAFYFSQKYKIPAIVLSDKHLAESFYTLSENAKIIKSEKLTFLKKYNSYEHDEKGIATENAEIIKKNFERRLKKQKEIEKEAEKFEMFKFYGKKDYKNLIVSWGSPKGAILDAIKDLSCKFLQILYIEPFSVKIVDELRKAKNIIIIENNATSPLSDLIREKTGILIEDKNKILRYDGRPFLSDELNEEIRGRLK